LPLRETECPLRFMKRSRHANSIRVPKADTELIQIVDAALAEAARKSGDWLACRPGCTQCCVGVFAINQLDAARLRRGMADLKKAEPQRAAAIQQRARESIRRLAGDFPGDGQTGILDDSEEAQALFANLGDDEVCPVLDPVTGWCELYEARPMTCRVFGPPVRSGSNDEDGLGVCELCYHGATDAEIAACEMKPDPDDLETALLRKVETAPGTRGETIVAFCVAG
jgi:Fe-S-cluster containining protein